MKVHLLSLAGGLLLASVLSPRPAGAAGVLLRYHFVAGQVITYRVTSTAHFTAHEGSAPAVTATESQTYLAHYRFSQLRTDGAATLTIRDDHVAVRLTQAGKTSHPATRPSVTQFLQEPNGRQYTPDLLYYGAYSDGDLGSLSPAPVSAGSTWVSTLTDRAAGYKPSTMMTCHNALVGFVQTPTLIANVRTACSIHGRGESTANGRHYRFAASDSITGSWQFAVRNGRFRSQVLHETITEVGTVQDAKGVRPFSARETQTTVQQLVSVS